MRFVPLKSTDEMVEEYRSRLHKVRIPGAILLVAFYIGFVVLVGAIVRYTMVDSDTARPAAGPHSDAGDNAP